MLKPAGGGRVDWCAAANLIAYDAVTVADGWSIWTIKPDGSEDSCLTCKVTGLPANAVIGQPAWHPSCEWLVVQVQNTGLTHNFPDTFLGPGWGINSELWILPAAGGAAQRLDQVALAFTSEASLHPHFSDDGTQLFWTRREVTGTMAQPALGFPWNGWYLSVAPFSISGGTATLGAVQDLYRTAPAVQRGFFESHVLKAGTLWFSRTLAPSIGQNAYVDEGFRAPLADPASLENLTDGAGYWEEHAAPSPGGGWISFNSSRIDPSVSVPPGGFAEMSMGIYARRSDLSSVPHLLVDLRDLLTPDEVAAGAAIITSDYDWSPDGRELVVYFVKRAGSGQIYSQQIVIVELNDAF